MEPFAVELHQALSGISELSGIRKLLRVYVEQFNLFGAALWEEATVGDAPLTEGELYIQAQYFRTREHPPFYSLDSESISARCIRTRKPARHMRVNGVWDGEVSHPKILDILKIDAFISAPTSLHQHGELKSDATLTFYLSGRGFTDDEYERLISSAILFSAVYQAVRERVCLSLLTRVHDICGHLRHREAGHTAEQTTGASMDEILKAIGATFQFVESVVYLRDPDNDPVGRFSLVSKIWPWDSPPRNYYDLGDGGTGWVLQNNKPLQILDMATYEDHRPYYEQMHPGLKWFDRSGVTERAQKRYEVTRDELFPLSYACVPIIYDEVTYGALRCCISINGPYHIDQDILEILKRVADVTASWWDHRILERRREKDRRTIVALGAANRYVVRQMPDSFDVGKAIHHLLEVCRKSVPRADIAQAWLKDRDGMLRNAVAPERRLSLEDGSGTQGRNAFGYVLRMGDRLHHEDGAPVMFALPRETLARSFTVVPIVTNEPVGVLMVGSRQPGPWPEFISSSVTFFADQLALYLSFRDQLLKAKETEERMVKAVEDQGQLFLDFQHQLKSPIKIARNSAERMQQCDPASPEWSGAFSALISSTVRAGTVANNLNFFVSISQGRSVAANNKWNSIAHVLQSAEQTGTFLYSKKSLDRSVDIEVRRDYRYPIPYFWGDRNLVDLAIDNLLDNAAKYSYANTRILIEAGTALYGGEVYFSFRNKGLGIMPQDVTKLAQRGFRGERAKVSSPEGTGIGLWAVSEIMKSMEGRLDIRSTDSEGWNDIRLVFKGSGHDQINPGY